jgi:hypothetical protein
MNHSEFRKVFELLTGNPPLAWQERLFHDHFAKNDLPRSSSRHRSAYGPWENDGHGHLA